MEGVPLVVRLAIPNKELRCALARALNRYYAEVYADSDRLAPVIDRAGSRSR
ncbi:MAG: hypothetical protein JWN67_1830 [Actinomycetia bacterium]|nr:hypothetical protein [Actinomycetes bacterium]